MLGAAQALLLVPRKTGWDDMQHVELQLLNGSFRQLYMRAVGRIKRPSVEPDVANLGRIHTQFRRGRNCVYNASSALPGSGT